MTCMATIVIATRQISRRQRRRANGRFARAVSRARHPEPLFLFITCPGETADLYRRMSWSCGNRSGPGALHGKKIMAHALTGGQADSDVRTGSYQLLRRVSIAILYVGIPSVLEKM